MSHFSMRRAAAAALAVLTLFGSGSIARADIRDYEFQLVDQASFDYMFDPERRSPNGTVDDGVIFAAHYIQLMRDIRFVRLCAKLGLCDYWVNTGNWPDCAEAVAPNYDFKAEARRLVEAQGDGSTLLPKTPGEGDRI